MDNYKQIKTDLDDLRGRVEKSELWVYKSKGEDIKKKKKDGEQQNTVRCRHDPNQMVDL